MTILIIGRIIPPPSLTLKQTKAKEIFRCVNTKHALQTDRQIKDGGTDMWGGLRERVGRRDAPQQKKEREGR